jgi:transcriptional regulator with XRE-family HTH domain
MICFIGGDFMNYTERIRALHEDQDKTQTEIAQLLKVGQKTYSDYELGKTRIPVDSLIILAKFYNVSMDYICGVSDVKKPFPTD